MSKGHSFSAKARKGRGSYRSVRSDDGWGWSDDEAAALGKAEEGEINLVPGDDEEALLEALKQGLRHDRAEVCPAERVRGFRGRDQRADPDCHRGQPRRQGHP